MSLMTYLFAPSRIEKIKFFTPYVKGKKVIDIGCAGEGEKPFKKSDWVHKHISEAAEHCVGVDHNEKTVKELVELGYNIVLADAQGLNVDGKYDIVCAFDVIEHVEDLTSFFGNVDSLLDESGKLLISVPNPWFFQRFIRCFIKRDVGVNPDHVYWFCEWTITELLRRYGYSVERLEYGSGEPRYYSYWLLPKILRHTSIFLVAVKNDL